MDVDNVDNEKNYYWDSDCDGVGDGNGDGLKAKFNMIGDVPDIRMFKPLLRHWNLLTKTLIERFRN